MLHDIFKWEIVGKEYLHVLYALDIQEKEYPLSLVFINLSLEIADEKNGENVVLNHRNYFS